ncbi:MAG TPA: glycine cleavage system aminomethyltransferase GcvT [Oscillospiraceae bacterium]|nr:glycine cleavage system aminomethyltransferase GcvT [Oscillospiraceae bacterium]
MKKTPLNQKHLALNARMVDYAGWDMPVQYEGITEEVTAVREKVGMFDVSHMGEVLVCGEGNGEFLNWLLSRDITGKQKDQITYAILCYEDGGTVDDLLVYEMDNDCYMLVVNAANKDKDVVHINDSLVTYREKYPERKDDIKIVDDSAHYGQIAVQGPDSLKVMLDLAEKLGLDAEQKEQLQGLKRYRQIQVNKDGFERKMIISRTGYTGENGYEIYLPAELTGEVWDLLYDYGVGPAGLGARDSLRLEAGMPLYGHEMAADITPLEGDMGFFIDFSRDFQGGKEMKARSTRKRIALVSEGRAIPRDGYTVYLNDEEVGVISSGSFSPTLGKGIAFALVNLDFPDDVDSVEVKVRKKFEPFKLVKAPFVKK